MGQISDPLVFPLRHRSALAQPATCTKQREYLDGVIDDVSSAQDNTATRLDAEAFDQVDAVVCGLMCELPD